MDYRPAYVKVIESDIRIISVYENEILKTLKLDDEVIEVD